MGCGRIDSSKVPAKGKEECCWTWSGVAVSDNDYICWSEFIQWILIKVSYVVKVKMHNIKSKHKFAENDASIWAHRRLQIETSLMANSGIYSDVYQHARSWINEVYPLSFKWLHLYINAI